jgi:hypothetical protein
MAGYTARAFGFSIGAITCIARNGPLVLPASWSNRTRLRVKRSGRGGGDADEGEYEAAAGGLSVTTLCLATPPAFAAPGKVINGQWAHN